MELIVTLAAWTVQAGAVALLAALLALVFVTRELRRMRGMEEEMNCGAEMAD